MKKTKAEWEEALARAMKVRPMPKKKWDEFIRRLEGPEGCNFREKTPGDIKSVTWECDSTDRSCPKASAILIKMGFKSKDVSRIIEWCAATGGFCDCEILFNSDSAYHRVNS